jgi:hypothetical protein
MHSFKVEAVEGNPLTEKNGITSISNIEENKKAKIYKSKIEANKFYEI